MSFQFYDSANIEFGICRGRLLDGQFAIVPIDDEIKVILEEMVLATRVELGLDAARPTPDTGVIAAREGR